MTPNYDGVDRVICVTCGAQVEVRPTGYLASHNAPPNLDGYIARCGNRIARIDLNSNDRLPPPPRDEAQYRNDYDYGWYADHDGTSLEVLDARNASDAAYDGFFDSAAGRPKWHMWHCRRLGHIGCSEHD